MSADLGAWGKCSMNASSSYYVIADIKHLHAFCALRHYVDSFILYITDVIVNNR